MGFALWLVPSEFERRALGVFMAQRPISTTQGHTECSFAHFQPHITFVNYPSNTPPHLLSLKVLISPSPSAQVSTPVCFNSLHIGASYLGPFSIDVYLTPELNRFHKAIVSNAHSIAGLQPRAGRFPHFSLFYFDEAYSGKRKTFKEELIQSGAIQETEGVVLKCEIGGQFLNIGGYMGCGIWLMDCQGGVHKWKLLERCFLAPPPAVTLFKPRAPHSLMEHRYQPIEMLSTPSNKRLVLEDTLNAVVPILD